MSCSNCYNGCTDIISDKCVKYTGIDIPVLGIKNGDSLSYIEQAIIEFLTSTLDGTGIKIDVGPDVLCDLVTAYLPTCGDLTLTDVIKALIKSSCDLQTQIDAIVLELQTLNTPYTVGCLTGVTSNSSTHDIVQAIVTKLCAVDTSVTAISNSLNLYVLQSTLNQQIADYLNSVSYGTAVKSKMIPWVAMEYYGDITGKFDATGKGIAGGDWDSVYLCNGQNGTPDKRGRVAVGAIQGMGSSALDTQVDPAVAPNPNYASWTKTGVNSITLSSTQVPRHGHIATSTATQTAHNHLAFNTDAGSGSGAPDVTGANYANHRLDVAENLSYRITGTTVTPTSGLTTSATPSISVSTSVTPSEGNSLGGTDYHLNIQPTIACYYIMYIP